MQLQIECLAYGFTQMHGAAYGKGIYLSPHSSVSFGYSGMGHGIHQPVKKLPPVVSYIIYTNDACKGVHYTNLRHLSWGCMHLSYKTVKLRMIGAKIASKRADRSCSERMKHASFVYTSELLDPCPLIKKRIHFKTTCQDCLTRLPVYKDFYFAFPLSVPYPRVWLYM